VPALARTAVAGGMIVEVHPYPDETWSDGEQPLSLAELALWRELRALESVA
jgi:3-deoxy-D-arabino-heptulosonate 7-phosphate (DAHP) synthase